MSIIKRTRSTLTNVYCLIILSTVFLSACGGDGTCQPSLLSDPGICLQSPFTNFDGSE